MGVGVFPARNSRNVPTSQYLKRARTCTILSSRTVVERLDRLTGFVEDCHSNETDLTAYGCTTSYFTTTPVAAKQEALRVSSGTGQSFGTLGRHRIEHRRERGNGKPSHTVGEDYCRLSIIAVYSLWIRSRNPRLDGYSPPWQSRDSRSGGCWTLHQRNPHRLDDCQYSRIDESSRASKTDATATRC